MKVNVQWCDYDWLAHWAAIEYGRFFAGACERGSDEQAEQEGEEELQELQEQQEQQRQEQQEQKWKTQGESSPQQEEQEVGLSSVLQINKPAHKIKELRMR